MERSARGEWFQFNPGLVEASSSSPLWTVLGASLMRAGGLTCGVVGLKAVAYGAWLAIGALVYLGARERGLRPAHALLGSTTALAMPGTALNCLQGMENGVLAALVLGAVYSHRKDSTPARTAATFVLAGLACALRPEGIVPLFALSVALVREPTARRAAPIAAAAFACAFLPFAVIYVSKTGHFIPMSGVSRMMAARREAHTAHLGPVWFYASPGLRLAAYLPLPAAGWAAWQRAKLYGATIAGSVGLYSFGGRRRAHVAVSDLVFADLGVHAASQASVQERFWLDDRVRVASIDGVATGPAGRHLRSTHNGCPCFDDLCADPDLVLVQTDMYRAFARCRGALSASGFVETTGGATRWRSSAWRSRSRLRHLTERACA